MGSPLSNVAASSTSLIGRWSCSRSCVPFNEGRLGEHLRQRFLELDGPIEQGVECGPCGVVDDDTAAVSEYAAGVRDGEARGAEPFDLGGMADQCVLLGARRTAKRSDFVAVH